MKRNQPFRSILITGASSGIGAALAVHYAADGTTLFLCGRNRERLEETALLCRDRGAKVDARVLDVADREETARWIAGADSIAPLDLVIANAGISAGTASDGGIGENEEQVRDIFAVNLAGVLNTVHPAIDAMSARGSGQIVLMSSLAAFRGFPGAPAYSASKAAVRIYGEALRGTLAPYGIKVNVVAPGFVRSRITDANDFPMPFFMEAEKAVSIIAKGIRKNRALIAFPAPMRLAVWFLGILPAGIASSLLRRLPQKA